MARRKTTDRVRRLAALRTLARGGDAAALATWRAELAAALRGAATLTAAAEALGMARQALARWVTEDATLRAVAPGRGPGRPRLPQPTRAEVTGDWDAEGE